MFKFFSKKNNTTKMGSITSVLYKDVNSGNYLKYNYLVPKFNSVPIHFSYIHLNF